MTSWIAKGEYERGLREGRAEMEARLREVEQERDKARAKAVQHWLMVMRVTGERDAARADADRLAEALREAIEALEFDGQGYEEGRAVLAAHEAAK